MKFPIIRVEQAQPEPVDEPTPCSIGESPTTMWVGFTACGCVCAWAITHPRELTISDHMVLANGPKLSIWLKLTAVKFSPHLQHKTVEQERYFDGPCRVTLGGSYTDWSASGCQNPGGPPPGTVLDAWFPIKEIS